VFLNRGNHEDTSCNLSNHFKPNFNADCNKKFNQYGGIVFKKSIELFTYLPIATIVSNKAGVKCFVVHGGVSDRVDLKTVSASDLKRYEFESVKVRPNDRGSEQFTDLLWSDPMTAQTKPHFKANGCFPSSRGAGYLFGEDISRNFCIKHGFSAIIRSHEVNLKLIFKF
jgi:diadenosine tetraphosphatase ApaH/serine/threonine PP2A family protein phosphatase